MDIGRIIAALFFLILTLVFGGLFLRLRNSLVQAPEDESILRIKTEQRAVASLYCTVMCIVFLVILIFV